MPYKSKSQMRAFFAMEDKGELPQGTAREWAHETPNIKKLPEKVSKKASLVEKLAAAKTLRDRLVLVTKLAALSACRQRKIAAARKLAKYAQALEQGSSISKSAAVAGMSFREGAVVYSVMMDRVKQAEPGVMGRQQGPNVGQRMQQFGQQGGQMMAAKGPGIQSSLMAGPSAAMSGIGRLLSGGMRPPGAPQTARRPGPAVVPGAPVTPKQANMGGMPQMPQMPQQGGGVPWELLAMLGLGGGAGALAGAGMQSQRPVRGAVQGAGAGMGAVGGGLAGMGLGGLAGAAMGQTPGAMLGGAGLGGVAGAGLGGLAGNLMGQGVNNLTGGAPEDRNEEMVADSL